MLRQLVRPDMGYVRALRYLGHRVARLPGTPGSIAAGVSFGVAVSFTPFLGLHMVLAVALAWLTRANVIAAALGTFFGNPWTFVVIWPLTYQTGVWLMGTDARAGPPPDLDFAVLTERPWDLLVPMAVGAAPAAVLAWLAFYWPGRYLVAGYQKNRLRRRLGKARGRPEEGVQ